MYSESFVKTVPQFKGLIPCACFLFLLMGCFADYDYREEEALNLYNLYISDPQYGYTVTAPVHTVDVIDFQPLDSMDSWLFVRFWEDGYETYDRLEKLTIEAKLNDSTYVVTKYIGSYSDKDLDMSKWGSIQTTDTITLTNNLSDSICNLLPRPHVSNMPQNPLFIKMDDGSICFRAQNDAIYSSRDGLIGLDNSNPLLREYKTLVQKRIQVSIPHLLNEFIAKEKYLVSQ